MAQCGAVQSKARDDHDRLDTEDSEKNVHDHWVQRLADDTYSSLTSTLTLVLQWNRERCGWPRAFALTDCTLALSCSKFRYCNEASVSVRNATIQHGLFFSSFEDLTLGGSN